MKASSSVSEAGDATLEGQILVREQVRISGNIAFQGRIFVQNAGDTEGSPVSTNSMQGNLSITYNGTLGALEPAPGSDVPPTYVNNVSGWIER